MHRLQAMIFSLSVATVVTAADLYSISGLGLLGRNAHIPGETIDLTRQPIQAKRTALLVFRLTH